MPRLVRDPMTWLVYAQLSIWGYFLYGFGPVVPLLRREQETTAAVASLHSTGLAIGGLLGGLFFPALVRLLGRGRLMWSSLAGVAVSTGVFCLFRPLPATLATSVIVSMFGSMVVSCSLTALTERHRDSSTAAISEGNAAGAGMGVLAPLVVGMAVRTGLGWRPGLFSVAVVIGLVGLAALVFRIRIPPGSGFAERRAQATGRALGAAAAPGSNLVEPNLAGLVDGAGKPDRAGLPLPYWIAWTTLGFTAAVEVCLSLWAAEVLRVQVGMSAGGASAAVSSIVAGMFLGRLVGGRAALYVPAPTLLLAALGISTVGFGVFWLAGTGWLAVLGLIVLGLGNSLHYPLLVSMAVIAGSHQADRAAAYTSYSASIGFGLGPLSLGAIADAVGSAHRAFLVVPVLLAIAAGLTVWLGRSLARPATLVVQSEPG